MTEPRPFQIAILDSALGDLARRLAGARLSPPQSVPDGEPGDPAGEDDEVIDRIAGLRAYWRDGYDWRAQERRMNAVPQFRATVGGVGLHFLHVPGVGPDPMPLLLCNGWPSSMVEYLGVLSLLTDPAAHGDDPADSFTVVVPALPGYGFSDRCLDRRPGIGGGAGLLAVGTPGAAGVDLHGRASANWHLARRQLDRRGPQAAGSVLGRTRR